MQTLRVSEKAKDRVLNALLVCSLVLLVIGQAKKPSENNGNPPQNSYASYQPQPLNYKPTPKFDEIQLLPSGSSSGVYSPKPTLASSPSTPRARGNTQPKAPSVLPSVVDDLLLPQSSLLTIPAIPLPNIPLIKLPLSP